MRVVAAWATLLHVSWCGLLLGLVLIILRTDLAVVAGVSPRQEDVLQEFKNGLQSPNVLDKEWPVNERNPCVWLGVNCSAEGLITGLSLPSLGLVGNIPIVVASLSGLTSLDLALNNFTGSIPSAIGDGCPMLQVLNVAYNQLTGSIPPSLGNLAALEELIVHGNNLNGSLPVELSNCTRLALLHVFDNSFTGKIPPEYGSLVNLVEIRAGGNFISGELPWQLSNCTQLEILGVAYNPLSGSIPPEFGSLQKLITLNLVSTGVTGSIPAEVGNLTRLQTLALYDTLLMGQIPPEIGNLAALQFLWLYQNNLTGAIPRELGKLTALEILDLSQNQLEGSIPAELGNLQQLRTLSLHRNALSGVIPPELGNAQNLMSLQLYSNQLQGVIPVELGRLQSLSILAIYQNYLQGAIPGALGNCTSLVILDFSHNLLSGQIPRELFRSGSLSRLYLYSNRLSGPIPVEVGLASNLSSVRLGGNLLNGSIPSELAMLPKLVYLELEDNQLSGVAPTHYSSLIEALFLSKNLLTGEVPAGIGDLPFLVLVDLSDNLLTGLIPPQIGNLQELISLNLSKNSLVGPVPGELSNCQKMNMLDLGANMLSGEIPSEIGRFGDLEICLDLSWNKLGGSLPESMANLSRLAKLDVSHNSLSGSVMSLNGMVSLTFVNISMNQFSGLLPEIFSRPMLTVSYFGNPGLCALGTSCNYIPSAAPQSMQMQPHKYPERAVLAITLVLIFALATLVVMLFLVCSIARYKKTHPRRTVDPCTSSQWTLIPFQKLELSTREIVRCLNDANVIGRGGSGVVYRAELEDGRVIAVKQLWMPGKGEMSYDAFKAEVETLGKIRHGNILRLLGSCCNSKTKLLLYDYMPNGSLGGLLHESPGNVLDWPTRCKIAVGAAHGLAYLHHDCVPQILHRDVKSNNILVNSRFEAHVADFGLAKILSTDEGHPSMSRIVGSYGYIAPEYAYTLKITEKSDVYSFGVVLLEILTGLKPVESSTDGDAVDLVTWVQEKVRIGKGDRRILDRRLADIPEYQICEFEEMLAIALVCVSAIPNARPTMREVVVRLIGIQPDMGMRYWTKHSSRCDSSSKLPMLWRSGSLTTNDSSWSWE